MRQAEPVTVDNRGLDVRATLLARPGRLLVYLVNREAGPVAGVRLAARRQDLVPLTVRRDLVPEAPGTETEVGASGSVLVLPAFQDSAIIEYGPPR